VVVVDVLVVVVVMFETQSQQLPVPGVALPPFGARQCVALLRMLHLVLPWAVVRQQRTRAVPQVDLAAHLTAGPRHAFRAGLATAAFAHCM
jgi:hypothetical protein